MLLSGCSYKSLYSPSTRDKKPVKYEHIGVYLLDNEILVENNIDEGTFFGAGYVSQQCVVPGELGVIYTIACLPVAAAIGAKKGDIESSRLKDLKKEHGSVSANLDISDMQQNLQKTVLSYVQKNMPVASCVNNEDVHFNSDGTRNYSHLFVKGIDTVVEYKIVKITLDEVGLEDVPVHITFKVNSRLIKTKDNSVVDEYNMSVRSGVQKYKEWVRNDFALLRTELYEMLSRVVTDTIDEYFLLYYPTFPDDIIKVKREAPYYVLAPYYPKPELVFGGFGATVAGRPSNTFRQIDEQRPLMKWEPFPWDYDAIKKKRFRNISYDLKIYEYPGILVYKREGLKKSEHLLEEDLKKGTRYLWTVRARFELDKKVRVTEWSGLYRHALPPWAYDDPINKWWALRNPLYKKADYYPFKIRKE